jgi:hypothetical protein
MVLTRAWGRQTSRRTEEQEVGGDDADDAAAGVAGAELDISDTQSDLGNRESGHL